MNKGVETMVDSDGILWLNEKHIEERLDHKDLWVTAEHKFFRPKKTQI